MIDSNLLAVHRRFVAGSVLVVLIRLVVLLLVFCEHEIETSVCYRKTSPAEGKCVLLCVRTFFVEILET